MAWYEKLKNPKIKRNEAVGRAGGTLWLICPGCAENLYRIEINRNFNSCPHCLYHFPIPPARWIELLLDERSFEERDAALGPCDPLQFVDTKAYTSRVADAQMKSGHAEAFVYGSGRVDKRPLIIGIFVFEFMGGSMGSATGEKIARAFELALKRREPLVIISSSGGARMQEGMFSLLQMAKTCLVRAQLREAGIPFISVLANPTTGGVAASFSMLGDVHLAEPGALIGFAGPRVIEQTIQKKLPEDFQKSSFLLEHGMIDRVVHRRDLKSVLSELLLLFPSRAE